MPHFNFCVYSDTHMYEELLFLLTNNLDAVSSFGMFSHLFWYIRRWKVNLGLLVLFKTVDHVYLNMHPMF